MVYHVQAVVPEALPVLVPANVIARVRATRLALLALFFLSGVTGLVYEVIWTRMLTLVMGNTVFATSTVLAAFMGGLAMGSWAIGRAVDRPRWGRGPLGVYGLLECLLGLYCLALPLLLDSLVPLYRVLYRPFHDAPALLTFAQFIFSGLLILVPAALMGGTLPALSKWFVHRQDQIGSSVGRLYAINSFGAVIGAVVAGYLLIPTFGVRASLAGAAAVNLAIGLIAVVLQGKSAPRERAGVRVEREEGEGEGTDEVGRGAQLAMFALTVSGAAALIYEVAWTRTLSLLIGPTTQAFSLMVAAFITGLALGSWLISRLADREEKALLLMGAFQFMTAFSAVAFVPFMDALPPVIRGALREGLGGKGASFAYMQAIAAAVTFAVMLVPTTCLGAVFPPAVRLYSCSLDETGRRVGTLYAGNTLGAVIGSLTAGFVMIPLVGLQKTILIAAVINGIIGATLIFASGVGRQRTRVALAGGPATILVLIVFLLSPWDAKALVSGPYYYVYQSEAEAKKILDGERLLYYREGLTGTVAVKQRGEARSLVISGKVDASTMLDMPTQRRLGRIPLLLARSPQDVLVIGLGSGVTTGTVAKYPVKTIETVEISYEVKEAVSLFAGVNRDVLQDPRARLIIQDARNHLLLTDRRYDVIISEPSNPWMAGIGNLYTREFFALARARLRPDGLMGQWVQAYNIPTPILKRIIRTYAAVFPHVSLWLIGPGDLLLVGSDTPRSLPAHSAEGRPTETLKARLIIEGTILRDAVQDAAILTDDLPVLESALSKSLLFDTLIANRAWMAGVKGSEDE